jgi:hypothetical protein
MSVNDRDRARRPSTRRGPLRPDGRWTIATILSASGNPPAIHNFRAPVRPPRLVRPLLPQQTVARRDTLHGATVLAATVLGVFAAPLSAQTIEVAPFGGFRFGSALVDPINGRAVDVDGAPAVGLIVDVPLASGMQFEGAFSHQRASLSVADGSLGPSSTMHVSVDHWQAGGLQEFGEWPRARPFLTGVLGLTRYGVGGDNEIRFTTGAGGGVKLVPVPHVGVRLEGRVFATFVDAAGTGLACGSRGCLVALHLDVAWQAEFTAGLIIKLPDR